jgi:hypothetical protein
MPDGSPHRSTCANNSIFFAEVCADEMNSGEHQQAAGKQQSSGDLDRAATWAVAIILGIAAIAIGEPDIRCARLDSNQ